MVSKLDELDILCSDVFNKFSILKFQKKIKIEQEVKRYIFLKILCLSSNETYKLLEIDGYCELSDSQALIILNFLTTVNNSQNLFQILNSFEKYYSSMDLMFYKDFEENINCDDLYKMKYLLITASGLLINRIQVMHYISSKPKSRLITKEVLDKIPLYRRDISKVIQEFQTLSNRGLIKIYNDNKNKYLSYTQLLYNQFFFIQNELNLQIDKNLVNLKPDILKECNAAQQELEVVLSTIKREMEEIKEQKLSKYISSYEKNFNILEGALDCVDYLSSVIKNSIDSSSILSLKDEKIEYIVNIISIAEKYHDIIIEKKKISVEANVKIKEISDYMNNFIMYLDEQLFEDYDKTQIRLIIVKITGMLDRFNEFEKHIKNVITDVENSLKNLSRDGFLNLIIEIKTEFDNKVKFFHKKLTEIYNNYCTYTNTHTLKQINDASLVKRYFIEENDKILLEDSFKHLEEDYELLQLIEIHYKPIIDALFIKAKAIKELLNNNLDENNILVKINIILEKLRKMDNDKWVNKYSNIIHIISTLSNHNNDYETLKKITTDIRLVEEIEKDLNTQLEECELYRKMKTCTNEVNNIVDQILCLKTKAISCKEKIISHICFEHLQDEFKRIEEFLYNRICTGFGEEQNFSFYEPYEEYIDKIEIKNNSINIIKEDLKYIKNIKELTLQRHETLQNYLSLSFKNATDEENLLKIEKNFIALNRPLIKEIENSLNVLVERMQKFLLKFNKISFCILEIREWHLIIGELNLNIRRCIRRFMDIVNIINELSNKDSELLLQWKSFSCKNINCLINHAFELFKYEKSLKNWRKELAKEMFHYFYYHVKGNNLHQLKDLEQIILDDKFIKIKKLLNSKPDIIQGDIFSFLSQTSSFRSWFELFGLELTKKYNCQEISISSIISDKSNSLQVFSIEDKYPLIPINIHKCTTITSFINQIILFYRKFNKSSPMTKRNMLEQFSISQDNLNLNLENIVYILYYYKWLTDDSHQVVLCAEFKEICHGCFFEDTIDILNTYIQQYFQKLSFEAKDINFVQNSILNGKKYAKPENPTNATKSENFEGEFGIIYETINNYLTNVMKIASTLLTLPPFMDEFQHYFNKINIENAKYRSMSELLYKLKTTNFDYPTKTDIIKMVQKKLRFLRKYIIYAERYAEFISLRYEDIKESLHFPLMICEINRIMYKLFTKKIEKITMYPINLIKCFHKLKQIIIDYGLQVPENKFFSHIDFIYSNYRRVIDERILFEDKQFHEHLIIYFQFKYEFSHLKEEFTKIRSTVIKAKQNQDLEKISLDISNIVSRYSNIDELLANLYSFVDYPMQIYLTKDIAFVKHAYDEIKNMLSVIQIFIRKILEMYKNCDKNYKKLDSCIHRAFDSLKTGICEKMNGSSIDFSLDCSKLDLDSSLAKCQKYISKISLFKFDATNFTLGELNFDYLINEFHVQFAQIKQKTNCDLNLLKNNYENLKQILLLYEKIVSVQQNLLFYSQNLSEPFDKKDDNIKTDCDIEYIQNLIFTIWGVAKKLPLHLKELENEIVFTIFSLWNSLILDITSKFIKFIDSRLPDTIERCVIYLHKDFQRLSQILKSSILASQEYMQQKSSMNSNIKDEIISSLRISFNKHNTKYAQNIFLFKFIKGIHKILLEFQISLKMVNESNYFLLLKNIKIISKRSKEELNSIKTFLSNFEEEFQHENDSVNKESNIISLYSLNTTKLSFDSLSIMVLPQDLLSFALERSVEYPWIRKNLDTVPYYLYENTNNNMTVRNNPGFAEIIENIKYTDYAEDKTKKMEIYFQLKHSFDFSKIIFKHVKDVLDNFNGMNFSKDRKITEKLTINETAKILLMLYIKMSSEGYEEQRIQKAALWIDMIINLLQNIFYSEENSNINIINFFATIILFISENRGEKKRLIKAALCLNNAHINESKLYLLCKCVTQFNDFIGNLCGLISEPDLLRVDAVWSEFVKYKNFTILKTQNKYYNFKLEYFFDWIENTDYPDLEWIKMVF